jgi:hypothetical protein
VHVAAPQRRCRPVVRLARLGVGACGTAERRELTTYRGAPGNSTYNAAEKRLGMRRAFTDAQVDDMLHGEERVHTTLVSLSSWMRTHGLASVQLLKVRW